MEVYIVSLLDLQYQHNIVIYKYIKTMKSLTVFDPKKVFTEVVKSDPCCNTVEEGYYSE